LKTTVGIILGVLLGIIIVVGVSVWIVLSVFSSGNQPTNNAAASTSQSASPSSSPLISVPSNSVPISPSLTSKSPAESNVSYSVNVSNFQVSGLTSGKVNAQISNTGTGDAHNVWSKVEIICQGSIVKIGGQDYLRKDIGMIKAGQTVSPQVTINVSITDGIKISQNGATLRLTIYSDEKTETLSYDYHP
jgi:hypothetical protein